MSSLCVCAQKALAVIFCMLKQPFKTTGLLCWLGGSGQGREQHGISTFPTFSHTVMLQSADWRSGFYLHGNLATEQALLYPQHAHQ